MSIIEPVIRPPSEAGSLLLQVTTGCSSNNCTFCGAYMNKPFEIKSPEEISADIADGRRLYSDTKRIFLLDGDALAVGNPVLIPILDELADAFPRLTRVSSYANGYNVTRRTDDELRELYEHKLRIVYIGLESGNQKILDLREKKSTAEEMIQAVMRLADAGIRSSVIVLLGLGGREFSDLHIKDTISVLNRMKPRYLSFLSLMLIPGTPLYKEAREGRFEELDSLDMLRETHAIISGLELDGTVFRCNHASNFLPLEGRLPQDRDMFLHMLEDGLSGRIRLKPELFRGL